MKTQFVMYKLTLNEQRAAFAKGVQLIQMIPAKKRGGAGKRSQAQLEAMAPAPVRKFMEVE